MRAVLASALLLAACTQRELTVIDGSSQEAFEESVSSARTDLPDRDRLVFDRAIRTVGGRWHGGGDPGRQARVTFDGMTAAEIVADQRARETAAK